ncbi:hypothetical protein OROMI_021157 [Orobanche minor]
MENETVGIKPEDAKSVEEWIPMPIDIMTYGSYKLAVNAVVDAGYFSQELQRFQT